jgi:hypothetical protein
MLSRSAKPARQYPRHPGSLFPGLPERWRFIFERHDLPCTLRDPLGRCQSFGLPPSLYAEETYSRLLVAYNRMAVREVLTLRWAESLST